MPSSVGPMLRVQQTKIHWLEILAASAADLRCWNLVGEGASAIAEA